MPALPKDLKLTVMLDETEMAMLVELSQLSGVGMSQSVRSMIREKYAEKRGGAGSRKKIG